MIETVAIVGVGLIGASIGMALRERRLANQVIGIGRSQATLQAALERGALDQITGDLDTGVRTANLVILATPVDLIVPLGKQVLDRVSAQTLVTDCGSTKGSIVKALARYANSGPQFVGSHPLAGSEKTGPLAARADLFDGRTVVVTPGKTQSHDDPAVQTIAEFWAALGAMVYFTTPTDHDKIVARTSHLPHLVASALARITEPADLALTAGGWRDTTRIAAGDPHLWTQIVLDNRTALMAALKKYETSLGQFITALDDQNAKQIEKLLSQGKERRDALES